MSPQELFEYLQTNLSLNYDIVYAYGGKRLELGLQMINPATGRAVEFQKISINIEECLRDR